MEKKVMNKIIISAMYILTSILHAENFGQRDLMPAEFWGNLSVEEKVSFVNGVYSATSILKKHHEHEVYRQHKHDPNWSQPYYIERYYDIIDEYLSETVGYDLRVIALHMDALYANYDNRKIPIMEAIRIVSLSQDGDRSRADLKLLQAQRKYMH